MDERVGPELGPSVHVSLNVNLRRLPILDAVRGFCTLAVIVYHYKGPILGHYASPLLARLFAPLWTCLDCFFVLSGFLLGGILLDNRRSKSLVPTFYARRALRILPVYLLAVAYQHWMHPQDDLIKFFTFTQNMVWAGQQSWDNPEVAVTWSLAVEEHFYLVLPIMIWLVPPRLLPWALAVPIAAAPLCRLYFSVVADNQLAASILSPCRMDALFLGVLLAWALRRPRFSALLARNLAAVRACVLVLGAAFAAYAMGSDPLGGFVKTAGLSLNGLFYTVFLMWLLTDHGGRPLSLPVRFLSWVGLGAFSIYLSHVAVMSAMRASFGSTPVAALGAASLIAALSLLSWHLIEKPCIQLGKRIDYRGRLGRRSVVEPAQP